MSLTAVNRLIEIHVLKRRAAFSYVYQYWQDPELGWMNARIQTWFPFSIQICLNGREWLARQMKKEGLGFQKQDNCFVWVEDWERAQQLLDEQLRTDLAGLLNRIARRLNPRHEELFTRLPVEYYWSTYQSEWASNITLHQAKDLRRLFPRWLQHAMLTLQSADILKFLGRRVTAEGEVPDNVRAEVTTSLKHRQPGARIKHWYGKNSLKSYDKAYTAVGSTLRAEVTIQDPDSFKVYRRPEGQPESPQRWYRLRHGVADLHRRAESARRSMSGTSTRWQQ